MNNIQQQYYCCARFVDLRNLQKALRSCEMVHAQSVNFWPKPNPNPILIVKWAKLNTTHSTFCKLRRAALLLLQCGLIVNVWVRYWYWVCVIKTTGSTEQQTFQIHWQTHRPRWSNCYARNLYLHLVSSLKFVERRDTKCLSGEISTRPLCIDAAGVWMIRCIAGFNLSVHRNFMLMSPYRVLGL